MTLTLAEYEARCLGNVPGEITPADMVQAINRVSSLGAAYQERLFAKAAQWKSEPRTRRPARIAAKKGGIEKSLPNGDTE